MLTEALSSFHQELGTIMCAERERKSIRRGVVACTRVLQKPEHLPLIS